MLTGRAGIGGAEANHVEVYDHVGLGRRRPHKPHLQALGRARSIVVIAIAGVGQWAQWAADRGIVGEIAGYSMPWLDGTILKAWVGDEYGSSWTSAGDQRGRSSLRHRYPDGAIQNIGQLLWDSDQLDVIAGDVLEQAHQVDLLLIGAAHGAAVGLSDDRHYRDVVEYGVVESVEQMDCTRARRAHTYPNPTRELGVTDLLERAHLFVARLNEFATE